MNSLFVFISVLNRLLVFGTSMLKTCEHLTKSVPYTINICSEHCKRNTTRDSEDIRRFGTDFTTQQEFKCDPFLISIIFQQSIEDCIITILYRP